MRVMNVKFVGRIIMTVLFVFICIGAHAGDDPLKYEIEGEGVGAQGIYLVKVTVIQKKSKLDVDVIKKCAVHGVLFKGFSSQTSRTRQKPFIIRKSKFPQNPKRSVRFSGKRTKRSVQKRKARNTQKAETKVL